MPKRLPASDATPVIRTDFRDDGAWAAICAAMQEPDADFDFQANIHCVSDPAYEGTTPEQIAAANPDSFLFFIVDQTTLDDADQPVLVVDVVDGSPRTLRTIPGQMWCVENNLSLANMDFEDFEAALDDAGVFRGF